MSKGFYDLGSTRGIGSSTRKYTFCRQTNPQPWTCIYDFINITPAPVPIPVPGKMKAVFLLELSEGDVSTTDNVFVNTLNYFWNTYPQEFIKCSIVDTQGKLETNLSLLDEYYNLGYRYFIGFTSSNILTGVLNWFNFHSQAIGMTIFGVLTTLNIPKNVYRFLPDDNYRIKYIPNLTTAPKVYYIYQNGLLVGNDINNLLINIPITNLNVLAANVSDLTVSNISSFLSGSSSSDILITLFSTIRSNYINLYSEGLTFSGQQYDITANQLPTIPIGTASTELLNKYNVITFNGINTSILWRNGYNTLSSSNYNITALNILNMLNQFANRQIVDNINSHYSSLIFNPVTKDTEYPSILLQKYNGTTFINTNLYVKDPYLGEYTATFVTNTPVSTNIIPISPNKSFNGKAIGLFDLVGGNQSDYIIYQSLYYFWSKDSSLPKFPTVDISNQTSSQVANLLTNYYNQGYRLFLGPNYAFTLATPDVLNWFSSHPDAICINLFSGADITDIPLNIYRLTPQASEILPLLISKITNSIKVYYIYDAGDTLGETVNQILSSYCIANSKTYKHFAIDSTHSNLTVPSMLDFFGVDPINNPVTVNDINIIVSNSNLQNYLNLYSDVSMNQIVCPQYIGTSQVDPTIPVEGTVLNENLYTLDITYPSSSYLWNENRLFLTDEYSSNTDSRQLLNALKMMQYILAGKDIKLLGSHLGTLQFSATNNNIMFPSVLIQQYQSASNKFVNYELDFTDPLLGVFTASFV